MHTRQEIVALIEKYQEEGDFEGGVSEEKIIWAERQLGVIFPEEYKWFLRAYGEGGVLGLETLGINQAYNDARVVDETLSMRKVIGLTPEYIMVENSDEFFYCLNTETGEVIMWYWDGIGEKDADTFLDYLYECLQVAIEDEEGRRKQKKD